MDVTESETQKRILQLRILQLEDELRGLQQEVKQHRCLEDSFKFVIVLLDINKHMFKRELLSKGEAGGRLTAEVLRGEIARECSLPHDVTIVIRLFINWNRLRRFLLRHEWIPHKHVFADFLAGFRRAAPFSDVIDAGFHKDTADDKLFEFYQIHRYQRQCCRIILGYRNLGKCSTALLHDQSEPFITERLIVVRTEQHGDGDHDDFKAQRIVLRGTFETQPFNKIAVREEHDDDKVSLDDEPTPGGDQSILEGQSLPIDDAARNRNAAHEDQEPARSMLPDEETQAIAVNSQGRRVDERFGWFDLTPFNEQHQRQPLCAHFHLGYGCSLGPACKKAHGDIEHIVRLGLMRRMRMTMLCAYANECRRSKCFAGHQCPWAPDCSHGWNCRFGDLHGKDTAVACYVYAIGKGVACCGLVVI